MARMSIPTFILWQSYFRQKRQALDEPHVTPQSTDQARAILDALRQGMSNA